MAKLTYRISDEDKQAQTTWLDAFLNATPDQVENYIDNNVNDLQSAKTVLKKLARVVVILAKAEKERRGL